MTEPPTWGTPPVFPVLGDDGLHVWRLDLTPTRAQSAPRTWLSADERQRADRFKDGSDAARFVRVRSGVRAILGRYLDADPQALRFLYGTQGKPRLAQPHAWLCFNLSHSRDLALVAVTRMRAVGVDVERIYPRQKLDQIARRVFTREQLLRMDRSRGDAWLREFFENWTALEARLKARGLGIFDRNADTGLQELTLRHLAPHAGYLAAVAVAAAPGPPGNWSFFSYPESSLSDDQKTLR